MAKLAKVHGHMYGRRLYITVIYIFWSFCGHLAHLDFFENSILLKDGLEDMSSIVRCSIVC